MIVTVKQIPGQPDEVIIQYDKMTPEIERMIHFAKSGSVSLVGKMDDEKVQVKAEDILYIETVDQKTFVYTDSDVVRVDMTLTSLMEILDNIRFFRCSKSMIINIDKVLRLKSLPSNRIDATMQGGEHILISRTYASEFRKRIAGGGRDHEGK